MRNLKGEFHSVFLHQRWSAEKSKSSLLSIHPHSLQFRKTFWRTPILSVANSVNSIDPCQSHCIFTFPGAYNNSLTVVGAIMVVQDNSLYFTIHSPDQSVLVLFVEPKFQMNAYFKFCHLFLSQLLVWPLWHQSLQRQLDERLRI